MHPAMWELWRIKVETVCQDDGVGEVCAYCGKSPADHLTYDYDHKPILLSEIMNERKD